MAHLHGISRKVALVRELEDGPLELIAGERRKYSALKAGLSTIPVFVRDDLSPVHQLAGILVENHDREGLTPVRKPSQSRNWPGSKASPSERSRP
jgi:hypothetical protein